jgi:pimeloyl-ACP methyl ester carboxylesterase
MSGTRLTDEQRDAARRALFWARLGRATGIARLLGRCRARSPTGLEALAEYFDEAACDPTRMAAALGELEAFDRSAAQVARRDGALGDRPLVVISQDPDRPKPGWDAQSIANNPIWASLQHRSMRLSSRSARIIAQGSRHQVHLDRPDVIIAAVSALVARLHGQKSALPLDGTTTTR